MVTETWRSVLVIEEVLLGVKDQDFVGTALN